MKIFGFEIGKKESVQVVEGNNYQAFSTPFLKEHQDRIVFAGLENERDLFCRTWDLDIPRLEVDDFYQLAAWIKGCKFFLGNQSFCFQLAEAMKVNRILELFPMMPNVIPVGNGGYDFYHQGSLDYYFNKFSCSTR